MTKPEWGVKRICPACSGRYYDLGHDSPVCPTCGVRYDPEALLKTRRARSAPVDKAPAKVPLAVREELGVDVDKETAVELDDDDTVPITEVEVAVDDEDLEEDVTETVHDLDDEEDLGELLAVDDEEGR